MRYFDYRELRFGAPIINGKFPFEFLIVDSEVLQGFKFLSGFLILLKMRWSVGFGTCGKGVEVGSKALKILLSHYFIEFNIIIISPKGQ